MSLGRRKMNTSIPPSPEGTGRNRTRAVKNHRCGRKIMLDVKPWKIYRFRPKECKVKYDTTLRCNMYHHGLKYKVQLDIMNCCYKQLSTLRTRMKKAVKLLLNTPSHNLDIMVKRYNETYNYRVLSIM